MLALLDVQPELISLLLQEGRAVRPITMPILSLAATAIDQASAQHLAASCVLVSVDLVYWWYSRFAYDLLNSQFVSSS